MRSRDSNGGRSGIWRLRHISRRPMCSWTRCAAVTTRGGACASTCSTCPWICGRSRRRSTRTRIHGSPAGLLPVARRAEHLLDLERHRDVELIVPAVARLPVGTPSQEDRRMAEAIALQVVVLHFAHAFDAQRLPREILSRAPA